MEVEGGPISPSLFRRRKSDMKCNQKNNL